MGNLSKFNSSNKQEDLDFEDENNFFSKQFVILGLKRSYDDNLRYSVRILDDLNPEKDIY